MQLWRAPCSHPARHQFAFHLHVIRLHVIYLQDVTHFSITQPTDRPASSHTFAGPHLANSHTFADLTLRKYGCIAFACLKFAEGGGCFEAACHTHHHLSQHHFTECCIFYHQLSTLPYSRLNSCVCMGLHGVAWGPSWLALWLHGVRWMDDDGG